MEYSTNNGSTWTACTGENMAVTAFGWNGAASVTVQFRLKAVTGGGNPSFASDPQTVIIPARPTLNLSINNENEGVRVREGYYYGTTSDNYDEITTAGDGSLVHVEPNARIYIYQAATDDAFKSSVKTLTAPNRGNAPSVPGIDYENETLTGTNGNMQWGVASSGQSVPEQWTSCTESMTSLVDINWMGSEMTVYFRTEATSTNYASDSVSLAIPARRDAPDAPTVTARTDTSITITAVSGVEYRLGTSGTWQTGTNGSITFTGLTANTPYTIYARTSAVTQGESPAFASRESSAEIRTKASAPEAPIIVSGSYTVSASDPTKFVYTITPIEGAEYSMDGASWQDSNVFDNLTPGSTVTFYARLKETEDAVAGNVGQTTATLDLLTGTGTVTMADWVYGQTASAPVPTSATNGTGGVTYEYKERYADDSTYTTTRPTDAGLYTVRATFAATATYQAATATYQAATATADFEIRKATPTLTLTASAETLWGRGEVTLTLEGVPEGVSATVTCDNGITVTAGSDGSWTATLPDETQTYTFTAALPESANYQAATATCTVSVTYIPPRPATSSP